MEVQCVSERKSDLGEGPHWDVHTQKLYYVDAFVGDVCRLDPKTGYSEVVHIGELTTFVIPYHGDSNQLLISVRKDVKKLDFGTGETEYLGTVDPDTSARFNDGKCDERNRLWTGTVVEGETGHLYKMDSTYNFISQADDIKLSNGLAWSLNNETLYYNDSEGKKIFSFDFNLEEGSASNKSILFDFDDEEFKDHGFPDGMTIDIEGNLWVACYSGEGVLRLDPRTKTIIEKVDIPAKNVTSCCFGGPHFDILYVTTASNSQTDVKYPNAGAVFAVTGHGTRGQPPNNFSN